MEKYNDFELDLQGEKIGNGQTSMKITVTISYPTVNRLSNCACK